MLTGSALAQWWEWPKIAPDDNLAGDRFGYAVAIDNELAIIGARDDDNAEGDAAGAAYIYAYEDGVWTQVTKLLPSTIGPGDRFGIAVDLLGNRAIVGSYSLDGHTGGVAYIFEDDGGGWSEVARLRPSQVERSDQFGVAVALSHKLGGAGNDQYYAIVGSPQDDGCGSAYIFNGSSSGWSLDTIFRPPGCDAGDQFGTSVGMWHNDLGFNVRWTAIGAPGDDDNGSDSGAVYFHRYEFMVGGWFMVDKESPSDVAAGDQFGASLSARTIDWDMPIIIGAPSPGNTGAAYVYESQSEPDYWEEAAKLTPLNDTEYFGRSVSMYSGGNYAVVGAPYDDEQGVNAGAAYIFQDSGGWAQIEKLTASDSWAGDYFGFSVSMGSLNGSAVALVGAPGDDDHGSYSGAAYVISRSADNSISGMKWEDVDASGTQDPGDEGLQSWRIYLDTNQNSQYDTGEPYYYTNSSGNYWLPNLEPGTYIVAEEQQTDWVQTYPAGAGTHTVTIGLGESITGVDFGNHLDISSPVDDTNGLPDAFSLYYNIPNPFNATTTIRYDLPKPCNVSLDIFDVSGRVVRTLLRSASQTAGRQEMTWHGRDDSGCHVASGVYFYRLEAEDFNETRRMVLAK